MEIIEICFKVMEKLRVQPVKDDGREVNLFLSYGKAIFSIGVM